MMKKLIYLGMMMVMPFLLMNSIDNSYEESVSSCEFYFEEIYSPNFNFDFSCEYLYVNFGDRPLERCKAEIVEFTAFLRCLGLRDFKYSEKAFVKDRVLFIGGETIIVYVFMELSITSPELGNRDQDK